MKKKADHVVIGSVSDVDEELLGWLQEAYEFSSRKQHHRCPHRDKDQS